MVTQITDKLRQQTLDEISATAKPLQYDQLRGASKESETFDVGRKSSKTSYQHRRSHTCRNIKIQSFGQDGPEGSKAESTLTGRCHSYPPAKKRLCRSVSDPSKDQTIKPIWSPEPSSIWTPVKPRKSDRGKPTGARSLEFTSRETFSWSTPPESPIPRPVSANSALGDSTFFPLRLISEESDNSSCYSVGKTTHPKPCSSFHSTMPRSHSHPSFSTCVNNGLKRRFSEEDIPRPALDFDKMKARSFVNTSTQKRNVKSPKYSQKRQASVSPKNIKTLTSKLSSENCNYLSVDLDSSLMITPTASPTDIGEVKALKVAKCAQKKDENSNTSHQPFTEQKYLNFMTLKVNTDLDIKLIEEDGTLDNEIHNNMLF